MAEETKKSSPVGTKSDVHAFNSLVTCSAIGCDKVAWSRCSACRVCYYCSPECQDRDYKQKHGALCKALGAYFIGTAHHVVAYANGATSVILPVKQLIAIAKSNKDLLDLFRQRLMWFEIVWPLEMEAEPSTEDVKRLTAKVLESKTSVIQVARHVVSLRREGIPWPSAAGIACGSCLNKSPKRPWFESAFKDDFVFPEVCIIFRVAGVVPAPDSLRDLHTDPRTGLTCAQIDVVREAAGLASLRTSFGRSLGFLILNSGDAKIQ